MCGGNIEITLHLEVKITGHVWNNVKCKAVNHRARLWKPIYLLNSSLNEITFLPGLFKENSFICLESL